jgi:hypothetical protein
VSPIDCLPARKFRPSPRLRLGRILVLLGLVAFPIAILSSGFYVGTYTVTSWSTFTRDDGSKIVDGNEDIYCKYLTLHGVVTRGLGGRDMVCPCTCPLFDPGRKPLANYDSDVVTPASGYRHLMQSRPFN